MATTTFTALREKVAQYLHTDSLTANIPGFIEDAEWRIARDLKIPQLLTTGSLTVAVGGSSVALPTDYIACKNVKIESSGAELQYCPPDTIDRITSGSTPWAYTLIGSAIVVAPTWTDGGGLSMTYYKKEAALSDTNATNWYLANTPDLLLFASLMNAAPFLVNDERIPTWKAFYEEGRNAINAQYGVLDMSTKG